MNENIQLEMNPSVKKQRSIGTSIALFSQDIDNYSFDITFTDLELQAGDQVEVLAKLQGGKLEHKSSANLVEVDGNLIARYVFDTKLIDGEGHVFCYVYLKRGDKSADVGAFYFEVDLSELDKVGGKIAEVYDGRYEDLVAGFEIKLQEYRESLPQADSVRAEVDEVITQFGLDSQAKLNQYDTDAQQVIADNQTAFGLAESGRQDTYEQAEDNRNQSSNQAVVDWEQDADAIINVVEANESARVDAEANRKTAETDRVSSESNRKTDEASRKTAETNREASEATRKTSEANRIAEENVRKANEVQRNEKRIRLKNEVVNGDFSQGLTGWLSSDGSSSVVEDGALIMSGTGNNNYPYVHTTASTLKAGDLCYIKGKLMNLDEGALSIRIVTASTNGIFISNPTPNVQYEESKIVTSTGSRILTQASYATMAEAIGKKSKFDDILIINLTQTFGAGNEPTKEQMDELLAITGYISGERVVSQQEMFKLMMARAKKKQEDWITPTLTGGATGNVKYRKNEFGKLEFKGKVTGTQGIGLFTLAVGYAPQETVIIGVTLTSGSVITRQLIIRSASEGSSLFMDMPYGTHEVDMSGISITLD